MKWFRFPRVLGIVVCLYLVGLVVLFSMLSMQSTHFVRNAARTQGTVVALVTKAPVGTTRNPASTRTVSLNAQVSYLVNGHTYDYVTSHGRLHQRLKVGDQVEVQYDPANPARARLKGEGRVLVPGIAAAFAAAALLVAGILFRTRNTGLPSAKTSRRSGPLGKDEQLTVR